MLTKDDLSSIRDLIKEENKPIKEAIKKVQRTLNATIRLFDNDLDQVNKRVARVDSN